MDKGYGSPVEIGKFPVLRSSHRRRARGRDPAERRRQVRDGKQGELHAAGRVDYPQLECDIAGSHCEAGFHLLTLRQLLILSCGPVGS